MPVQTARPQLAYLGQQMDELKSKGTYFKLRVLEDEQAPVCTFDGKQVINLASNNYLGLTHHPKLREAAIEGHAEVRRWSGRGAHDRRHHEAAHGAGREDRALQERGSLRRLPIRLHGECGHGLARSWAKKISSSRTS